MVIDGDGHCNEPRDLFDRYLEKEFRDDAPKIVPVGNVEYWMIEGKFLPRPVGNFGHGSAAGYFGTDLALKGMATMTQSLDDVAGRIKDLDKEGIDIQIAYPNIMAMASHLDDAELAVAMCRGYNNYAAEKAQAFNGRVKPVAVGVHWITGYFDSPGQERFKDPYFYIHMVGMPFNLMIGIMTLIGGGVMEKYPRIRFVFLEIGAAWLPYWMWRRDDHYSRGIHNPTGVPKKPSDYVRSDSCFVSCEPDEDGLAHTIDVLGSERVVFASDYPHGDCDFPHSVTKLRRRGDIFDAIKDKILWDNAARLYGLS